MMTPSHAPTLTVLVLAITPMGCARQPSAPCPQQVAAQTGPPAREAAAPGKEAQPPADRAPMYALKALSVCPTPREALANQCESYSVEWEQGGVTHPQGGVVTVLGEEPAAGVWPAVMFKMSGQHTGYVDAARVAAEPDMAHAQRFADALEESIPVHEYPQDFDMQAWSGGKTKARSKARSKSSSSEQRVYVRNISVGEQLRGCAASGGEWVECGLVFTSSPMRVGRWVQPDYTEGRAEWPVLSELIMTSNGWLYEPGEYVDMLIASGEDGRIKILAVVDRFGVWPAKGSEVKAP